MPIPAQADRRTAEEIGTARPDVIAPAVLGTMTLAALLLYALTWSRAIANEAVLGQRPEVPWLHAHVASYLLGDALLVGTLALSVYFRVTQTSPRGPWLELAVLVISGLFIAGVCTGFQFTRPVWGYNPWRGDGKLLSAVAAAVLTAGVVLPLSVWMRPRVQPNLRHVLLACCLVVVAALAAFSFFYPARSIHPEASLLPFS